MSYARRFIVGLALASAAFAGTSAPAVAADDGIGGQCNGTVDANCTYCGHWSGNGTTYPYSYCQSWPGSYRYQACTAWAGRCYVG